MKPGVGAADQKGHIKKTERLYCFLYTFILVFAILYKNA